MYIIYTLFNIIYIQYFLYIYICETMYVARHAMKILVLGYDSDYSSKPLNWKNISLSTHAVLLGMKGVLKHQNLQMFGSN